MTAKVLAVGNLKGGSGKTTLAVNLACALSASRQVQLLDADEQGSATAWASAGDGLGIEVRAAPLDNLADMENWIRSVTSSPAQLVVIDLPPNGRDPVTAAALMIADLVLIPVRPSIVDIRATTEALALVRDARQARGDGLPKVFLAPSQVDRRTRSGLEIDSALHELGEPVAPAIGIRAPFVDAAAVGGWVGSYAPRSIAHVEIMTLAAVVERTLWPKRKE